MSNDDNENDDNNVNSSELVGLGIVSCGVIGGIVASNCKVNPLVGGIVGVLASGWIAYITHASRVANIFYKYGI